ncbi:acyl-CoA thioesterase II [Williamsia sp. DF01-3]|uniref:acyl-CoA thioesterase n=1 Tax=Williamsia sp. DF01-3 TaxID=2934157 RepID=UPI001FF420C0|nr:acyl-CoA thioesterase domain-containing protein [Williamsia sp. DF01-3]MCK0516733.1 thioesterase family protein [Williamsia sp. DF01-3]
MSEQHGDGTTDPPAATTDGTDELSRLITLIELEPLDVDRFRAVNDSELTPVRLFGGLIAAQALRAAQRTVSAEFGVHSLHTEFLRSGPPDVPLTLVVHRSRDGRSFASRTVTVIQSDQVICTLTASFHVEEPSPVHEALMPIVPGPDEGEWSPPLDADWGPQLAFEHRGRLEKVDGAVVRRYWTRPVGPVPDDPALRACLFTVLTDFWAMLPAVESIGLDPMGPTQHISLDHSIWFHRDIPLDEWILVEQRSVATVNSRGLVFGSVFSGDGATIASVAQEALIRGPRGS